MQPSRHQRLRLRRILLASIASLLHLLLCWLAYASGHMRLDLLGMLALNLLVIGSFAGFLLFTWFNLNLHFRDPSLTLPQMAWAIVLIFISAYYAEGLRSLFLMMVLVVLMFGAFRLQLGGFVRVGVFTLLCYAVLLWLMLRSGQTVDWQDELMHGLEFFVLLFGVSLLGLEMSGLRQVLQTRNHDLRLAMERIQQLAITDELTGLYNRRFVKELVAQQKALADRGNYQLVLCLVDLDYFKAVNDQYGHAGGDAVLRQLGALLKSLVRDVDFAARMGGEEFLLVLSRTDTAGARQMLQRLRLAMAQQEWAQCPGLRLTLSLGMSAYRPEEDWQDCLQRADDALYRAKHAGRDQLVEL